MVKDRLSEDAIEYFYTKFMRAAPTGMMTPALFKKYIDDTGVYKDRQVQLALQRKERGGNSSNFFKFTKSKEEGSGSDSSEDEEDAALQSIGGDGYLHLFRGYDIDGDGIITFKEFLIYHLAVLYNTEELFTVIFNSFDEDGDGYLSLGDIQSVITASTRYVGDYDVRDREVRRVILEEARRLIGFLDIRKEGKVHMEDMRLVVQRYPQVLEKMKNLM
ncbi:calcium-binding protein CML [Angomonas deanei]|nr:calcium-binding protein CML [Angomonas deanei]|eukprot:EPY42517.1 calcium-binding protein CML [Angomonas deanei]